MKIPFPSQPKYSYRDLSSFVVFIFFFSYGAVIILTFQDYGITWDEYLQKKYGNLLLSYYHSFTVDQSFLTFNNLRFYGGLFDILSAFINLFSPFGEYETRHLLNAFFGFSTVLGTYFLAKKITRFRVFGLMAALFLVLTPRFYGHSFNNPKDIPFATFYLLFVVAFLYSVEQLKTEQIPKKAILFLGLTIGGATSIRVGGLILVFYLVLFYVLYFGIKWALGLIKGKDIFHLALRHIVLPCLIAYGVTFAFWPYLHFGPISHIFETVKTLKQLLSATPVLFDGQFTLAGELPWYYIPKLLLITTPLPIIVGVILSLIFLAFEFLKNRPSAWFHFCEENSQTLFVFFSAVFPVFYSICTGVALYDGLRHFLFLLPLIAVLATIGYFKAYDSLNKRFLVFEQTRLKPILQGWVFILSLSLSPVVTWVFKNHPNQYTYYNEIVGGVKGASVRGYELDYWGNSFKEASLWLNDFFKDFEKTGRKLQVMSISGGDQSSYFFNGKIFQQTNSDDYDIAIDSYRFHSLHPGHIIKTVGVDGVAFTFIIVSQPLFDFLKNSPLAKNFQEIPRLTLSDTKQIPTLRPGFKKYVSSRCSSGLFTLEFLPATVSSDWFYRCEGHRQNNSDNCSEIGFACQHYTDLK